jgi:hypothetical protein
MALLIFNIGLEALGTHLSYMGGLDHGSAFCQSRYHFSLKFETESKDFLNVFLYIKKTSMWY